MRLDLEKDEGKERNLEKDIIMEVERDLRKNIEEDRKRGDTRKKGEDRDLQNLEKGIKYFRIGKVSSPSLANQAKIKTISLDGEMVKRE